MTTTFKSVSIKHLQIATGFILESCCLDKNLQLRCFLYLVVLPAMTFCYIVQIIKQLESISYSFVLDLYYFVW